jgi:hypothetical protein
MSQVTTSGRLAADVADAGTFTVAYPTRPSPDAGKYNEGDFFGAMGHKLVMGQSVLSFPNDFDVTLGTSEITITNEYGATWPAGTDWRLELQVQGKPLYRQPADVNSGAGAPRLVNRVSKSCEVLINLGAPDALVTNGVMAQQNITAAGAMLVNGTLATGGVATLDVPRNLIADSGGADDAILTVTGKDEYGQTMIETLTLNGTTAVAGKKAFKQVTGIAASKAVANTAFIGTGDVLGLPVFLPSNGHVVKELSNGTAATAGTFVAGLRAAEGSTATSADVRGTYDPNAAADGDIVFQLVVSLPDPTYLGVAQYAG